MNNYPNQYLVQTSENAIPNQRGQYRALGVDPADGKSRMFVAKREDGKNKQLSETSLMRLFDGLGRFIYEAFAGDLTFTILKSNYHEAKSKCNFERG